VADLSPHGDEDGLLAPDRRHLVDGDVDGRNDGDPGPVERGVGGDRDEEAPVDGAPERGPDEHAVARDVADVEGGPRDLRGAVRAGNRPAGESPHAPESTAREDPKGSAWVGDSRSGTDTGWSFPPRRGPSLRRDQRPAATG